MLKVHKVATTLNYTIPFPMGNISPFHCRYLLREMLEEQEVVHHNHSQKMLEELRETGPLNHSCHWSSPSFQTHPQDHPSL